MTDQGNLYALILGDAVQRGELEHVRCGLTSALLWELCGLQESSRPVHGRIEETWNTFKLLIESEIPSTPPAQPQSFTSSLNPQQRQAIASRCKDLAATAFLLAHGFSVKDFTGWRTETMARKAIRVPPDIAEASAMEWTTSIRTLFGAANPTKFDDRVKLWLASAMRQELDPVRTYWENSNDIFVPNGLWTFERTGNSIELLPDGRVIFVGGYEDYACPLSGQCYNDILVVEPDGTTALYGYPKEAFPPLAGHAFFATVEWAYLFGNAAQETRSRTGPSDLYRVHLQTFVVEKVRVQGDIPPAYSHATIAPVDPETIEVMFSNLKSPGPENAYLFDLSQHLWTRSS